MCRSLRVKFFPISKSTKQFFVRISKFKTKFHFYIKCENIEVKQWSVHVRISYFWFPKHAGISKATQSMLQFSGVGGQGMSRGCMLRNIMVKGASTCEPLENDSLGIPRTEVGYSWPLLRVILLSCPSVSVWLWSGTLCFV